MKILNDKDYFLFDGAMGTYYSTKTNSDWPCEIANLTDESSILEIHKEYVAAGADGIKTNTFGANRFSLSCEQQKVEQIIKKGWALAKAACEGSRSEVFADIGPIPDTEEADLKEEYIKIIDIFIGLDAKHFLFETFHQEAIVLELAAYIRLKISDAVIIASFAVYPDGYSKEGLYYGDILSKVGASGLADGFGLNCISGPAHMCRLLGSMDMAGKNIAVMPNSGYPSSERGRTVYIDNSEYFAEKIYDLKNLGVKILGGCCGTTPKHIAAVKQVLQREDRVGQSQVIKSGETFHPQQQENIINQLLKIKKPILVEIDPPFDTNWEYMLKDALLLKQAGADIITIADSPLAKARADSAILAAKIQREANIPVMPHITCRDKNLLGIKATLLGLHIEGIRNILVITGDPISAGERPNVKGVYSLNSSNLANYISSLNANIFGAGEFKIAGALNVNALNFEAELRRAQTKVDNGVSCFLTQAIYTEKAVQNLIRASETLSVPVFAGIMPIVSYKNAQFINNEVPGIEIDEEVVRKFKDKSREEAEALGIEVAADIVKRIGDAAGFYFMTPLKRTNMICALISRIREGR